MRRLLSLVAVGCFLISAAIEAKAVTVTVDPGAPWQGFMNVFNLPADGGGFVFGSGWGTDDLVATFAGPVLTLAPNTIGDPNPFWYQGGGGPGAPGNKIMDANMFVQDNSLVGETVTFTGIVLSNDFTSAHSASAFIRDFAPDFSSVVETSIPLTPGVFSITLATDPTPGRNVQYGFNVNGVNVWETDVAPFGSAQVIAIPEPTSLTLLGGSLALLISYRRRR